MALVLSQIAVYPIKSAGAMYPQQAALVRPGFDYDRKWLIIDEDSMFVTQRQFPAMAQIAVVAHPETLSIAIPGAEPFDVPIKHNGSTRSVTIWDTQCEAVDQGDRAANELSDFLGRPCRLVRMSDQHQRRLGEAYRALGPDAGVDFADSSPLMLIGEGSLDDLNSRLETPVAMNRFRPNLVVSGGDAFAEDSWKRISINGLVFHLVKDCIRCEIPTVDQETGVKGVEPMETLESYRAGPMGTRFGRKVVHESVGVVHVGDEVTVLE